jgi:molecular chaperone GrpE
VSTENRPDTDTPAPEGFEPARDVAADAPREAAPPERDDLAAAIARATEAETRLAQERDRALRAAAELDNVRKRTQRELADGLRFANESLVRELLPALDNLERALAATRDDGGPVAGLREGVSLTHGQLLGVLRKFGVTPVEAVGKPFDPNVHEAVQRVESDLPENTVVAELSRGYFLNGRLVRPAMVTVAAGKGA